LNDAQIEAILDENVVDVLSRLNSRPGCVHQNNILGLVCRSSASAAAGLSRFLECRGWTRPVVLANASEEVVTTVMAVRTAMAGNRHLFNSNIDACYLPFMGEL
jgi:hypothetical protein